MPELDAQQDWQLTSGSRNETHIVFEFWRPLRTEDAEHDVPIERGVTKVVYALGKVDPKDRTRVKYHGPKSRGMQEIEFF